MSRTSADVAVIGLGAIGSMTTWRLTERGVSVDGYDRFGFAHDRGASAGQSRRFSVQTQRERRLTPLAMEALELWRELEQVRDRALLHLTGGIIIGPRGTPALESAARSAAENGLAHETLDADRLRARFPQHLAREDDVAVTDPMAGYLRPEASVATALHRAGALGATLRPYTMVLRVEPRSRGVAVVTKEGERLYERVVLATGPWARELVPGGADLVVPRRLVQAWFLTRRPQDYHPDVFGVFERVGDVTAYGFPSLDGATIKIGVKFRPHPVVQDLDEVPRVVAESEAAELAGAISRFFPGLYPDPVSLQTGIEGYTPDERALLGPSPEDERLVVACGYSGSGFKFSPVMGEIAAELAATGGSSRDISFLAPDREFQPREPAPAT